MIKKIFIVIYFLLLVTVIAIISPLRDGFGKRISYVTNFLYAKDLFSGEAAFIYRGSLSRQGVVPIDKNFEKLHVVFQGPQINYGVHTASKSSVAVDESGYYVGTDEGLFYAFDFDNKIRWSYNFISSARGVHGTAVTDKDHVYVGNYAGFLLCFKKKDGQLLWEAKIADAIGTVPLLAGDFLYVAAEYAPKGAILVKLSRNTGEKIWQSEMFGEQTHSSPAMAEGGRIVVVGDNEGALRGIDAGDGQTIWSERMAGPIKNAPLIHENRVYVGSWNDEFCSFDYLSGFKEWCKKLEGLVQTSAALDPKSGDLFVQSSSNSVLYRLHGNDGKTVWKKSYRLSRAAMSSPTILVSKSKQVQLLASCGMRELCLLDPETGLVKFSLTLPSVFSSVPTVYKDEIFLSLDMGGVIRIK